MARRHRPRFVAELPAAVRPLEAVAEPPAPPEVPVPPPGGSPAYDSHAALEERVRRWHQERARFEHRRRPPGSEGSSEPTEERAAAPEKPL